MNMHQNIRKDLIRTTINCNANCLFCNFAKENETDFMNPSDGDLYAMIDVLADQHVSHLVFSGGEPLVRENIFKFIKYAANKGIKKLEMQTNGLLLDKSTLGLLKKSSLNRLFISLHTNNKYIRTVI